MERTRPEIAEWLGKIVALHDDLILRLGGLPGILDLSLLEAALHRPFSGLADGTEHFPDELDKAAALLEGLIKFHPFADGNKRTASIFVFEFIRECGYRLQLREEDVVDAAVKIATGEMTFAAIRDWLGRITVKPATE
jgi:death-on-curing protein